MIGDRTSLSPGWSLRNKRLPNSTCFNRISHFRSEEFQFSISSPWGLLNQLNWATNGRHAVMLNSCQCGYHFHFDQTTEKVTSLAKSKVALHILKSGVWPFIQSKRTRIMLLMYSSKKHWKRAIPNIQSAYFFWEECFMSNSTQVR